MEWTGEGLIIGVRRHGENAVIVETMTDTYGRYLGLVRGGRSRKHAATLQPGNQVHLHWRARLEEHLGAFTIELIRPRAAAIMANREQLYTLRVLCAHLHLLPERDPHPSLLDTTINILDASLDPAARAQMLSLFELALLDELGFGLDLSSCAVTGETEGLTHVSPKTGRAVTSQAGDKYLDRLLKLPAYFSKFSPAENRHILDGLELTGHFLQMHVWGPRQIDPPSERDQLLVGLREAVGHSISTK